MKKRKKKLPYMPRVVVKMNTGTRVIKSKKDKMNSRQALKRRLQDEMQ